LQKLTLIKWSKYFSTE